MLTKEQFEQFVDSARARGFTHVKTSGGNVALEDWHPYGAFGGGNPGIEDHMHPFHWEGMDCASDNPQTGEGAYYGLWTFLRVEDEADVLMAEQTTNYYRDVCGSLGRRP